MDYQSNRNKDKEEPKEPKPEKQIVKVVTGEVIKKPNTISRKFRDIFFGGDAKSALRYVTADVLLPTLRDLIVDVVARGTARVVYGETGYRRRMDPPPYEGRVQYNNPRIPSSNPLDHGRYRPPIGRLPDQNPSWQRTKQQRIGDIVIASREEAENVVTQMYDVMETYQNFSVADYYETLGLETTPIDNKWGWTYLNNIQIRQVRQGYVIELPPAEEL